MKRRTLLKFLSMIPFMGLFGFKRNTAYSCIYPPGYTLTAVEKARYPVAEKRFTSISSWAEQNLVGIVEIIPGDATNYWTANSSDSCIILNGKGWHNSISITSIGTHLGVGDDAKYKIN